jgi:uroporphyrinogen-III synthase
MKSTSDPRKSRMSSRKASATSAFPLVGLRILVGRARHQAGALSSGLRKFGAEVLDIPFIEIRKPQSYKSLDRALLGISDYDWLILTSVNGVEALWERLRKLRIDRKRLGHLKIAAIGPATKRAIEEHGLKVNVVPREYVAESVVASLRSKVAGKRVLLARAKVARDVIPRELGKLADRVDVAEAYETIVPQSSRRRLRAALASTRNYPDVITFTSSSTVKNFVALLPKSRKSAGAQWMTKNLIKQLENASLASIGPVTSSTLRELGLRVDIQAREYTIPGLIDAIVAHRKKQT